MNRRLQIDDYPYDQVHNRDRAHSLNKNMIRAEMLAKDGTLGGEPGLLREKMTFGSVTLGHDF